MVQTFLWALEPSRQLDGRCLAIDLWRVAHQPAHTISRRVVAVAGPIPYGQKIRTARQVGQSMPPSVGSPRVVRYVVWGDQWWPLRTGAGKWGSSWSGHAS